MIYGLFIYTVYLYLHLCDKLLLYNCFNHCCFIFLALGRPPAVVDLPDMCNKHPLYIQSWDG